MSGLEIIQECKDRVLTLALVGSIDEDATLLQHGVQEFLECANCKSQAELGVFPSWHFGFLNNRLGKS